MAKSVGSVEVQVGAKIDALQTELRKARGEVEKLTATHRREMAKAETASKGFVQSIGGIKTAAAAAGVAMAALVRSSSAHFAQLDDNARALRINVESYQALSQGFSLAGVSEALFSKSLQRLSRTIGDASRGVATAQDKFSALGIAFSDANGVARSTDAVFRDVADAIAQAKTPAEQASIAMELLGDRTGRMATALTDGSVALDGFEAAARRMGTVLDTETIAKLAEVDDQLEIIGNQAKVAGGKAAAAFLPAIKSLVDLGAETSNALESISSFAFNIGKAFAESLHKVKTLDDEILELKKSISSLETKGGEGRINLKIPELNKIRKMRKELKELEIERKALVDSFVKSDDRELASEFSDKGSEEKRNRSRPSIDMSIANAVRDRKRLEMSVPKIKPKVEILETDASRMRDQLTDTADRFRIDLADAFISGATTGFDGMIDGFSRTLQRLASDLLSSQFLSLLRNIQGGGSSGGGALGFLGKIGGAIAGVFGGPAGATAGASAGSGSAMSAFFPGFATGGEFKVGGSGGTDSQLVAFRASPDETVSVRRPDQMQTAGATINNNVTVNGNPDGATLLALKRALADNSRATIAQIAEMQRRGRFA